MSLLQLLRPGARPLVEVLTKLPNCGVGARVTRASWEVHGDSYWEVTDVKLRGEGRAGKAWGVLTWRGVKQEGPPRQIEGAAKRVWRWAAGEEEAARLRPLAEALAAQRRAAREGAAADGGGGAGGS